MLSPLPDRDSAVDACERSIRTAILAGRWPIGSRLPPERDVAAQLGVNRVTVRSALSRLEATNLVTVRQGSGYTVRDYWRVGGPDLLLALAEQAQRDGTLAILAADLLRVRRHLARMVLEILADQLDVAGHTAVDAAIDAFAAAIVTGDIDRIALADAAITASLVAAAHSRVIALFLNPALAVVPRILPLRDAMYRDPQANLAGWTALRLWLRDPDKRSIDAIMSILESRDAATTALLAPTPSDYLPSSEPEL